MKVILVKFWPILIPFLLFFLWWFFIGRKKRTDEGEKIPMWEARLWFWTLVAAIVLAVFTVILLATENSERHKGGYTPPTVSEDGQIVPGTYNDETRGSLKE